MQTSNPTTEAKGFFKKVWLTVRPFAAIWIGIGIIMSLIINAVTISIVEHYFDPYLLCYGVIVPGLTAAWFFVQFMITWTLAIFGLVGGTFGTGAYFVAKSAKKDSNQSN